MGESCTSVLSQRIFLSLGGGEEGAAVPVVGREAPDAGLSPNGGGGLAGCVGGLFCGGCL